MTLHHDEETEVRINSLLDEEAAWFNSRVKCFPLYTLMLAVNHTNVDVLSLGCQGQELQVSKFKNIIATTTELIVKSLVSCLS